MIAIVDDDKSVREFREFAHQIARLCDSDFRVRRGVSGSGRLRDTECLITDVRMPGMNGVDLQSRLIANGNRTPVIFVTADPDERLRERALAAGALGFLSKPFREENLIASHRAMGTTVRLAMRRRPSAHLAIDRLEARESWA